jgi:hypothetical protein
MITCTFHASVNPNEREDNGMLFVCAMAVGKKMLAKRDFALHTMGAHNAVGIFAYFFVVFPQGVLPFKPAGGKQKAVG